MKVFISYGNGGDYNIAQKLAAAASETAFPERLQTYVPPLKTRQDHQPLDSTVAACLRAADIVFGFARRGGSGHFRWELLCSQTLDKPKAFLVQGPAVSQLAEGVLRDRQLTDVLVSPPMRPGNVDTELIKAENPEHHRVLCGLAAIAQGMFLLEES